MADFGTFELWKIEMVAGECCKVLKRDIGKKLINGYMIWSKEIGIEKEKKRRCFYTTTIFCYL